MVRKYMELIKLLNTYLNHFPKHEKYALSNKIRNTAYEVYDCITEGHKRYHKKTTLRALDVAHERLRMQIYLAYELGYFRFRDGKTDENPERLEAHRYGAVSARIDELGRMIGGWLNKELDIENDGGKPS